MRFRDFRVQGVWIPHKIEGDVSGIVGTNVQLKVTCSIQCRSDFVVPFRCRILGTLWVKPKNGTTLWAVGRKLVWPRARPWI